MNSFITATLSTQPYWNWPFLALHDDAYHEYTPIFIRNFAASFKEQVVVKKLKLEGQASVDFRGLGIVSPEKDYRLCYLLNNELGFDFDKSVNIAYYDPAKNKRKAVSCYIHNDTDSGTVLYFVKNKQEGFFMVPEMKEVDFVFLEPLSQADSLSDIKKMISKLDSIQSCFVIPGPKLKNIDAE